MVNFFAKLQSAISGNSKLALCVTFMKRAILLKMTITIMFILINIWYGGGVLKVWSKLHWRDGNFDMQNTTIILNSVSPICDKFPSDVSIFNQEMKDSSFCCSSCALVSSSGQMIGSKAGSAIDLNECVIRMNNAPVIGYETDVGSRTTLRIFSHSSVVDVKYLLRTNRFEENSTVFIVWGPERNMKSGAITNRHLNDMSKLFPNARLYTFAKERLDKADQIFEVETGKNRLASGAYLSTGFFSMLFANDICNQINVYGMVEDDHCSKVLNRVFQDAPYHYYQRGSSQCSTYRHHENTARGGHRFITEKRIFKKWAKEWGNTRFHNPEWML